MAPPTIAPARKPAPTPQPHPRPCTLSTVAGTAFLIASASATGIAGATVASEAMPAARTIVTANLRAQLLILLPPWCESPCEGSMVRIDVGANKAPPPSIGSINVGAYRPLAVHPVASGRARKAVGQVPIALGDRLFVLFRLPLGLVLRRLAGLRLLGADGSAAHFGGVGGPRRARARDGISE